MIFRRDDLKAFFDIQITKIFALIDQQLVSLQQKCPNEQVAHLVLSGSMGNSAYVQALLWSRYAQGYDRPSNAHNLQIRVAPEPQLVVCYGNVADRVQKLRSGRSILSWRCCRASYGTKCKVFYEPNKHIGLPTEIDKYDGEVYVGDCIDWLIKKVSATVLSACDY